MIDARLTRRARPQKMPRQSAKSGLPSCDMPDPDAAPDYASETVSELPLQGPESMKPGTYLFVVMDCSDVSAPSSRHALERVNEVQIGRGSTRSCDRRTESGRTQLRLSFSDPRISGAHARLTSSEGKWIVDDLGSKNGIKVNGAPATGVVLSDGDIIQIGHTVLVFRDAIPTPMGTPRDLTAEGRFAALSTLSPALVHQLDVLARAAPTSLPVLLLSETGTGKELLARAIHQLSRRPGNFVPVNCAALTDSLAQSALFGHRKGSFSGAVSDHLGLFREAHQGTLLLDEVGDMTPSTQSAILRTLQDGEVLPIGETRPRHVDVRIVAATNRNLDQLVADASFREDLLARLSGLRFRLPPLRERKEDIGLIVRNLMGVAHPQGPFSISPDVVALFLRRPWHGNIRELEKCLAFASAMAQGARIEVSHLPEGVRNGEEAREGGTDDRLRASLVRLLEQHRGNVAAVAEAMETSRSQIHRLMKRLEIDPARFRR
jgi:transcriptional regulator with AAA-type ATPase domain